jgi:hypothetical protein
MEDLIPILQDKCRVCLLNRVCRRTDLSYWLTKLSCETEHPFCRGPLLHHDLILTHNAILLTQSLRSAMHTARYDASMWAQICPPPQRSFFSVASTALGYLCFCVTWLSVCNRNQSNDHDRSCFLFGHPSFNP